MSEDWRTGLTAEGEEVDPAWREHLAAARQPTTLAQDMFDRDWLRWRGIALRSGRSQLAAIEIAYTRTQAQHGPRPEPKETQT